MSMLKQYLPAIFFLIVIGSLFLPWVRIDSLLGEITENGIDTDDGKIGLAVAVVGIAASMFMTMNKWMPVVASLAGLLLLGGAIYEYMSITGDEELEVLGTVEVGLGLWLMGAASAAALLASLWYYMGKK